MEETDDTDEPPDHAPPEKCVKSTLWDFPSHKTARSGVWEYFEYFINPEGELEDYGFPTCKLCQLKVACKRGNTSNMLRHLQEHHTFAYREAKVRLRLIVHRTLFTTETPAVGLSQSTYPIYNMHAPLWMSQSTQSA